MAAGVKDWPHAQSRMLVHLRARLIRQFPVSELLSRLSGTLWRGFLVRIRSRWRARSRTIRKRILRRTNSLFQCDDHRSVDEPAAGKNEATLLVTLQTSIAREAILLDEFRLGAIPAIRAFRPETTLPILVHQDGFAGRVRHWIYSELRNCIGISKATGFVVPQVNAIHFLVEMRDIVRQ